MKNLKVLLASITILLFSCSEDTLIDERGFDKSDPVIKYIIQLGFDDEQIEDIGGYYLVEEDILFDKNEDYWQNEIKGDGKQARRAGIVGYTDVRNITVSVNNTIPNAGIDNWRVETEQAVNDWNNSGSAVV